MLSIWQLVSHLIIATTKSGRLFVFPNDKFLSFQVSKVGSCTNIQWFPHEFFFFEVVILVSANALEFLAPLALIDSWVSNEVSKSAGTFKRSLPWWSPSNVPEARLCTFFLKILQWAPDSGNYRFPAGKPTMQRPSVLENNYQSSEKYEVVLFV